MGLNSTKIFGISITTDPKEKILEYLRKYLSQATSNTRQATKKVKKILTIVTPNPEQIVFAKNDERFAKILNKADVAIPDGIGVVAAMRLLNFKFQISNFKLKTKRIPGVELMEDLVKIAADRGYTIGLIGGRGGLAVKALECLQKKHPGLALRSGATNGWAEDGPELQISNRKSQIANQGDYVKGLVERIIKSKTQIVFVGLGAPKQEYFIEELAEQLQISNCIFQIVLMSVGGSFDIIAGKTPRAPLLLRALGLEWLWRLARQPSRWRRQLALLRFIQLVLTAKFKV